MTTFAGRERELTALYGCLARVAQAAGPAPGATVLVSGPRRVGKSRLVEEFLARVLVPSVYVTAGSRAAGSWTEAEQVQAFVTAVAGSDLPASGRALVAAAADSGAGGVSGQLPVTWAAAFDWLLALLPADGPSIVVLDDLPLLAADQAFSQAFRRMMDDGETRSRRLLLVLIAPDSALAGTLEGVLAGIATIGPASAGAGFPAVTPRTATYFSELRVDPIAPSLISERLGLSAADAFDAYLVTGGLPSVLAEWTPGDPLAAYLASALRTPGSALLVNAERLLAAELPSQHQARDVLSAIGSGERGFASIGRAAGGLHQGSLLRALGTLRERGLVAADVPLSTERSRETRYRVADPALAFWLSFLGPGLPEIERGRGDLVLARIQAAWPAWRQREIAPVLRQALARTLFGVGGPVGAVGGYWTRSGRPEIDVVVADRGPIGGSLLGIGAIRWQQGEPFDDDAYGRLLMQRAQLPGADRRTPLFAVSSHGSTVPGLRVYTPEEFLVTW